MFEELGGIIAAALHRDKVRLARPIRLPDGMGGFVDSAPEELGAIACSLQSYSAERAQNEYGVACRAERRLFCAPDARIVPGVTVDGSWVITTVPEKCESHIVALLEEVQTP